MRDTKFKSSLINEKIIPLSLTSLIILGATTGCSKSTESLAKECINATQQNAFTEKIIEAYEPCRKAALSGDAKSQYWLGYFYHFGTGTPRSYVDAAKWWLASAKQGDIEAQINIAGLYKDGAGVTQDAVRAHMWYNIAAANEDSSLTEMAKYYRERIAMDLSKATLTKAEQMATRCKESNYREC
jgi:uncharacterized protein